MPDDSATTEDDSLDDEGTHDPSVPTDLLDLHVQLEEASVTAEEFGEAFG